MIEHLVDDLKASMLHKPMDSTSYGEARDRRGAATFLEPDLGVPANFVVRLHRLFRYTHTGLR
jgi:hypothetical protein